MTTNIPIAVASSVSREHNFNTLDALSYAIEHHFAGFQPYMNDLMINDPHLRETVRHQCAEHQLALVIHAPATLTAGNIAAYPIYTAVKDLFPEETRPLVVQHYDETISLAESLSCLGHLSNLGITTCLENYFIQAAEASEKCLLDYLALLRQSKAARIPVIPVFDISRLYHDHAALYQKAPALTKTIIHALADLEIPVILHLIDAPDYAQARTSWCPIGQGIIPYKDIFQEIQQARLPLQMMILEYEDKINPIESRKNLENLLRKYHI